MFKTCPRQTLLHWKDLEGATVTVSVVRSEELQSCLAETSEASELHEFMSCLPNFVSKAVQDVDSPGVEVPTPQKIHFYKMLTWAPIVSYHH